MTVLTQMLCKLRCFIFCIIVSTVFTVASVSVMLYGAIKPNKDLVLPLLPYCSGSAGVVTILCAAASICCDQHVTRYDEQRLAVAPDEEVRQQDVPMLLWLRPGQIIIQSLSIGVLITYVILFGIHFSSTGVPNFAVGMVVVLMALLIAGMISAAIICPPQFVRAIEHMSAGHPGNHEMVRLNENHHRGRDHILAEGVDNDDDNVRA